jgi:hypothetical protein
MDPKIGIRHVTPKFAETECSSTTISSKLGVVRTNDTVWTVVDIDPFTMTSVILERILGDDKLDDDTNDGNDATATLAKETGDRSAKLDSS